MEDWAEYVAELAFQTFLLMTPNRGCCYISEPLKSRVASATSLVFSLGNEDARQPAYLLSHVTITALLMGVELMENGFKWASLTKALH